MFQDIRFEARARLMRLRGAAAVALTLAFGGLQSAPAPDLVIRRVTVGSDVGNSAKESEPGVKRYRYNRSLIHCDNACGRVDMRCCYNHENWRMKCYKTYGSARGPC